VKGGGKEGQGPRQKKKEKKEKDKGAKEAKSTMPELANQAIH
jgi:hypothetical protein